MGRYSGGRLMPNIVLCIPGCWQSTHKLSTLLRNQNIFYSNGILVNLETSKQYKVELYEHDERLGEAFLIAGQTSFNKEDICVINSHTYAIYIIGKGGSIESAMNMMRLADKVLQSGGLAIKIESSGIAHNKSDWGILSTHNSVDALYYGYVALLTGKEQYYSCGMHNLGFSDASISRSISPNVAEQDLETFLIYLLQEKPKLKDGDLFSKNPQSQTYRLKHKEFSLYSKDDLFHNPFGMWQLELYS